MDQARQRFEEQRWKPGTSGCAVGGGLIFKQRREAIAQSLLDELGNPELSALDQALLRKAVDLLTRKPRDHNDQVRLTNTAHRIVRDLRERYAPKPQDNPDYALFAEYGHGP